MRVLTRSLAVVRPSSGTWRITDCGNNAISRNRTDAGLTTIAGARLLDSGFTLVELIAAMALLLILTGMALPLARNGIIRWREAQLHQDLQMMRNAIDRYCADCGQGRIPMLPDTFCYPPNLKVLAEGVRLKGRTKPYKYIRNIPVDPMTGSDDWGLRSMQDDPDSRNWGGQNVFNVYSKSQSTAMDGTLYADW